VRAGAKIRNAGKGLSPDRRDSSGHGAKPARIFPQAGVAWHSRDEGFFTEYFRLAQSQGGVVCGMDIALFGRDGRRDGMDDCGSRNVAGSVGCDRGLAVAARGAGDEAGIGKREVGGFFPFSGALFDVWSSTGEGVVERMEGFLNSVIPLAYVAHPMKSTTTANVSLNPCARIEVHRLRPERR